jgi:hypothetical protein
MEDADINMEEAFACLKFARSSPMQVIHTMSPSDVLLSDELWASVASFLSLATLKLARLVSKRFNQICSRDEAGWKQHRDRLWSRRFHVSVDEYRLCSAMEAYMKSCADARLRHTVRLKELIYDPQSDSAIVWSFRFKEVAGTQWTQSDPWYQGRQARQFAFLENGHVKQRLAGPAKPNGVELKQPFFDAPNLPGGLDIRWRFVAQPIDFPRKEMGAYIRLTIAGRDVPTYLVHRSVSGNWGFLMENCCKSSATKRIGPNLFFYCADPLLCTCLTIQGVSLPRFLYHEKSLHSPSPALRGCDFAEIRMAVHVGLM